MVLAAHHVEVAGVFRHIDMLPVGSTLFLPFLTTLGLFPSTGFLLGHFWGPNVVLQEITVETGDWFSVKTPDSLFFLASFTSS